MNPKKFQLNLIYRLGADVITEDFSNSESLCCSDASHQVSAQSNLLFGRRCHLKNMKMAPVEASSISEQNYFRNSESLCGSETSHQV